MATIELIPSGYTGSTSISTSSSYPISNGYTDTSSTTYARLSLSTSTTGYLYYTFDCSDIPSTATISSIAGSAKVRVSSTSRVTSTQCQLYTGTTAKGSNVTFASTSSSNIVTLSPGSSWTRSELDDLRLKIGGTGSSSSQSKYIYFYGAELTITYFTESRTVTTTLSGSGTINPSGATATYDGEEFVLTITPTNTSDTVTVTNNGTDVTSELVGQYSSSDLISDATNLGNYTLVSGGFNGSGETYFSGIVGNGDDASQTSSNYYSSGSDTIAVFTYNMAIPLSLSAEILECYVLVNGHAESTSNSNEYMCAQIVYGDDNTPLSDELNFKSVGTSNSTQRLDFITTPTPAQLSELKLQCRLGYYGGAINGATLYIKWVYQGTSISYYTYTYTVNGDATIAVTIGSSGSSPKIYLKNSGSWSQYSRVYLKVNGSWIEQSSSTWDTLFSPTANYVRGD